MNDNVRYPISFYLDLLDHYVHTGECGHCDPDEPLHDYLLSLMNDPQVRMLVLGNEVCARYFYDTTLSFIEQNVKQERYHLQRTQSERKSMQDALDWTPRRKRDGWQVLLQQIGQTYRPYGFNVRFYENELSKESEVDNPVLWEHLIRDWEEAYRRKQADLKDIELNNRKESLGKRLNQNLTGIPAYLQKNNIPYDDFHQAWGLMGGMWNTSDFQRLREVVKLQRSYPVLEEIAKLMGRVADDDGKETVRVSGGNTFKLVHSSRCDIEGITVGNDLNALLPVEMVQCTDDDFEELFIHKYMTRNLQSFRYKSEIMNPARSIQQRTAKRTGPMIVCVDTSGSMSGLPEKLSHSLVLKLLSIAEVQKRELFLVTFSVNARPIDVKNERTRVIQFFQTEAAGDTDATRMIQTTLDLISCKPEFFFADVLWISDFRIPLVVQPLLSRLKAVKDQGTRFYGLKVGVANHAWEPWFDRIFTIESRPHRKF